MAKIIRNVLIILVAVAAIMAAIQWKNYQKKSECRENALIYFKEADYQKSISYLQEGLDQISFFGDEMDDDMSCYLGESYYQLGEYEQAVSVYDSLISRNAKEKKYYLLKAEAYTAMQQNDQAVETLEKGWKKTKDESFLLKICDNYLDAGQYDKALEYADKGTQKNGDAAADFLFRKVIIYEKSQDYQSAYETAREYVSLYPDDEKGQRELTFLSTRI